MCIHESKKFQSNGKPTLRTPRASMNRIFASFRKRSWNQWHHIRSHHRVILVCKNHAFGFLTELFKDFKNSSMGALWNEVPLLSSCSLLLCFLVELSSFRLTRWIGDSWLGDREWLIDEIEVVELLPLSKKGVKRF